MKSIYDSGLYDPSGIYNVDETFFSLSYGQNTRRIAPRDHPRNGQSVSGSTEHITVVACIGLDTAPVPPLVIYPGQDLYDVWFTGHRQDVPQRAVTSNSGWINSFLMQKWLEDVFDPFTSDRVARGRRRLLFLDGHDSHVKVEFLEACWDRNIVVVIIPANASGFLQPLDVGFFGPLKTRVFGLLDDHRQALDNDPPAKGVFWRFHQQAWKETAMGRSIRSSWRKAGLWPLSSAAMGLRDTITPPRELQPSQDIVSTPRTPQTLKRHKRSRRQGDIDKKQDIMKLEKALEIEMSQKAMLQAQVDRDQAARQLEKAARGKRKRVNYPHGQVFDPEHREEHAEALADRKARETEARRRRQAKERQPRNLEPQEPRQACTPGPSTAV